MKGTVVCRATDAVVVEVMDIKKTRVLLKTTVGNERPTEQWWPLGSVLHFSVNMDFSAG